MSSSNEKSKKNGDIMSANLYIVSTLSGSEQDLSFTPKALYATICS